jgi:hypothetical protein
VGILRHEGIEVVVVQDEGKHDTPDSVFPNNWISFHKRHSYITYPMFALNRRLERQLDIYHALKFHSIIPHIINDYSSFEQKDVFLEGTGSLVLDRVHRVAYAAVSPRTHK